MTLMHDASPWQRTKIKVEYDNTSAESASHNDHEDTVVLLNRAIKYLRRFTEPSKAKAFTGTPMLNGINRKYHDMAIRNARRSINHDSGGRLKGFGVINFSFELTVNSWIDEKPRSRSYEGFSKHDEGPTGYLDESLVDDPEKMMQFKQML